MIHIGIDPGLDGAVGVIRESVVVFFDTPTITVTAGTKKKKTTKRKYDIHAMHVFLKKLAGITDEKMVVLEEIHSMPGQGVRSMFSMGEGFGIWKGLIVANRLPFVLVSPNSWKRKMVGVGKDKNESRVVAMQMFPNISDKLKRVKDHNRADALLLAVYGKGL